MKKRYKIPILGVLTLLVATAVLLFGEGILRKSGKKVIFCGIEQSELTIPASLLPERKGIWNQERVYIFNIFIRNESRSACMNPILTIRFDREILAHVLNATNEDKEEVGGSMSIPDYGRFTLRLRRLGPGSFIDLTVWCRSPMHLTQDMVSVASDGDFALSTKFITHWDNKGRFD